MVLIDPQVPASIAEVYPHDEFATDLARNARAKAAVLHEAPAFLAPFPSASAAALVDSGEYGGIDARRALACHAGEYAEFIVRIAETAAHLSPRASPGPGDSRLRGPRQ